MFDRRTAALIEHLQIGHLARLKHYTTGPVWFRIGIRWDTQKAIAPSMGLRITLKSALANPFLAVSIVIPDDRL